MDPGRIENSQAIYRTELTVCRGVNRGRSAVIFMREKALSVVGMGNLYQMRRRARNSYDLILLREKAAPHQLLEKAGIAWRELLAGLVAIQVGKDKPAVALRVFISDGMTCRMIDQGVRVSGEKP